MARLTFSKEEEFRSWVQDHATPDRYEMYTTSRGDILVAPTKSTRTLHQAVIRFEQKEQVAKFMALAKEKGFKVYTIDSVIWDIEKSPSQERPED
jgi:hypothetical protein